MSKTPTPQSIIQKTEPDDEPVIPSLAKTTKNYSDLFKKIGAIAAGEVANVAGCKFCYHPLRLEAEMRWEQTRSTGGVNNLTAIMKFLNASLPADASESDKISLLTVRTHIHHHYNQQQKRIALREYASRLATVMNYKIEQDEVLEGINQSLLMQFYDIAANPEIDEIKKVDVLTKLSKSTAEIIHLQQTLRQDVNLVDMLKRRFQAVFIQIVQTENNPERKQYMLTQLKTLLDDTKTVIDQTG